MHDHARLMNTRTDVEFYLVRLVEVLDVDLPGMQTPRFILRSRFSNVTLEQLSSDELRETANYLEAKAPQLFAMWGAYYSALAGVRDVDDFDKQLQYISATDKAIAMLSFETCVQMDQFYFCWAKGAFRANYLFSRMLKERQ
ncbi:hypothetical protein [Massilia eurypsychrophila]|nr:hypothetical protein [Massilia eurypsychrophila]